jgi:hypothetical protein
LGSVDLGRHVHLVDAHGVRGLLPTAHSLRRHPLLLAVHRLRRVRFLPPPPESVLLRCELLLLLLHLGLLHHKGSLLIDTPLLELLQSDPLLHCAHVLSLLLVLPRNQLHLLLELNLLEHLLLEALLLGPPNLLPLGVLELTPRRPDLLQLFLQGQENALVVFKPVDA